MSECIDPIIGKILAGWRYDISGIAPEMRSGYEEHLAACEHCRKWQRLHRTIDVSLIVLASVSAGVFLLAAHLVECPPRPKKRFLPVPITRKCAGFGLQNLDFGRFAARLPANAGRWPATDSLHF